MKACCLRSLQFAYYAIMVLLVLLAVFLVYCSIKTLFPAFEMGSYGEVVTAIAAVFALVVGYHEYCLKKDINMAKVLSEYNNRYSNDCNIVKVVKYLNYRNEGGKNNNFPAAKPSNYEVEMFMRFFEELEVQIKAGRLKEEDVFNLFTYYAAKIHSDANLRNELGINDYGEGNEDENIENDEQETNWDGYKRLMKKYINHKKDK